MGCDRDVVQLKGHTDTFQSTHPHGVRPRHQMDRHRPQEVSIHAPTWGATSSNAIFSPYVLFQSTHPHGVRRLQQQSGNGSYGVSIHAPTWGATYNATGIDPHNLFQSTHPHGVRLPKIVFILKAVSFNPRTHMGCDTT